MKSKKMECGYLAAWRSGLLAERIALGRERLESCSMCPRSCQVNRLAGERGVCRTGDRAEVASYGPHFGEESVLVGTHGSGTIFFCGCNLLCVFCQNWEISHPEPGNCLAVSDAQLGAIMVELQEQGCHNINFVTPSHVIPQILAALPYAVEKGLTVPLVYNSGGYDSVQSLQLLDGLVDIYMPDFKFWEPDTAKRYMHAADYPERAREAVREMHRQVGDLQLDESGLAVRGLLVRHLLMPGGLAETEQILRFLAREISPDSYLNIMDQYHPCGRAGEFPELCKTVSAQEYQAAMKKAEGLGFNRLDRKDFSDLLKRLLRSE